MSLFIPSGFTHQWIQDCIVQPAVFSVPAATESDQTEIIRLISLPALHDGRTGPLQAALLGPAAV